MTEPRSPYRHPIAFLRDVWAARRFGEYDDDPDQLAWLEMQEPLWATLIEDPTVSDVRFKSAAPNVVEVYLDPWSEASAQRARDVCAPLEAQVKAGYLGPDDSERPPRSK